MDLILKSTYCAYSPVVFSIGLLGLVSTFQERIRECMTNISHHAESVDGKIVKGVEPLQAKQFSAGDRVWGSPGSR